MTLGKMLRNVSVGLIFGIIAIGLLPFLVIFNWVEMINVAEIEASPLFLIIGRFVGTVARKDRKSEPDQSQQIDS
ncbi:hypothetical protein [Paenibacillus sp. NPDC058174]|uniref:hypothetical protein n=1 Tax=Paenibacillus sp. NPDC058174 TaxID=3346366 RepID=UPI0036DC92E6